MYKKIKQAFLEGKFGNQTAGEISTVWKEILALLIKGESNRRKKGEKK